MQQGLKLQCPVCFLLHIAELLKAEDDRSRFLLPESDGTLWGTAGSQGSRALGSQEAAAPVLLQVMSLDKPLSPVHIPGCLSKFVSTQLLLSKNMCTGREEEAFEQSICRST